MREGWTYKKLGDTLIFDKRFQGLNGCKQEKIVKFSHVSAEELKNIVDDRGNVQLLSTGNFTGFTTIEKAGTSLNKGEVITIPTGGTANIKYYNGLFVDSGNIIGVAIDSSIVLRFIYYAMLANNDIINSYYRGASIKHPYMPDIYKLLIPIPPVSVQQQIVSELDLLSSVIEKQKVQIEELDKLAQSIFYDMFGDPVENEKGWKTRLLSEIGELARGVSKHRPRNAPELLGGIMPLIQTGDVANAGMYIQSYNSTYSERGVAQSKVWKAGTLCITIAATIGKCAILSFDACFPDSVVGFSVNHVYCNNEYIYFIFMRLQAILEENAPAVAQKNINLQVLNNLHIPLPPLSLQQEFANKIQAIESMKAKVRQSLKESETLFNSRMDFYFS